MTLTGAASFERHLWLRAQLNRASSSVCANLAEGFGRYYHREFAQFARMSRGSLNEIADHLADVAHLQLSSEDELEQVRAVLGRTSGALMMLIRYLESTPGPRRP
jgi:four helix bundle protein